MCCPSSDSEIDSVTDSPPREIIVRPKSGRKKKRNPNTKIKNSAHNNTKNSKRSTSKSMVAVSQDDIESPKSLRKQQQQEEEVVTVAQMQRMEPVFQREIGALEDIHR